MRTRIIIECDVPGNDVSEFVAVALDEVHRKRELGYVVTCGQQDDLDFIHYEVKAKYD